MLLLASRRSTQRHRRDGREARAGTGDSTQDECVHRNAFADRRRRATRRKGCPGSDREGGPEGDLGIGTAEERADDGSTTRADAEADGYDQGNDEVKGESIGLGIANAEALTYGTRSLTGSGVSGQLLLVAICPPDAVHAIDVVLRIGK